MKRDQFGDADWPVLARYLSGECSDGEVRSVESWIASRPGRRQAVEELREVWVRSAALPTGAAVSQALERVASRAALQPAGAARGGRSAAPRFTLSDAPARRRLSRVLAVALPVAASVVLAVAAWVTLGARGARRPARPVAQAREYVTARAHFQTIVLGDGNRVTLGSGSRLSVPADYGARTRTVWLEGEASFRVSFDARLPFRVRTSTATTEDLGTHFVVRARTGDSVVAVAVAEGQVAVLAGGTAGGRRVVLGAGQVGRVARSGSVTVTQGVDVAAYIRWMMGDLVFHKTPLDDVRGALERWYGVRVELPDTSFAALPVTASLRDLPADEALGRLASLLDLRFTRHGDVVRFVNRPHHPEGSGT